MQWQIDNIVIIKQPNVVPQHNIELYTHRSNLVWGKKKLEKKISWRNLQKPAKKTENVNLEKNAGLTTTQTKTIEAGNKHATKTTDPENEHRATTTIDNNPKTADSPKVDHQ